LNITINEENMLTGGVSYEDFYSLPKTTNLTGPFDKDKSVAEQGYFYAGTNNTIPLKIYELNYTNIGAYLQLQSDITGTLSGTLGVRFDDNSRYGSTVNPRGGLVYQPRSTTTIKLLYGEAYQAPSPYRAYSNYGTFDGVTDADGDYTGSSFRLPSPDLEPEELKTWELGIIENIDKDLKLEADFFYTEAKDLITGGSWQYTIDSTTIPGTKIDKWKKSENAGAATWWGGEFTVDYSQSLSGVRLDWWANYSYLNGSLVAADGTTTEHPRIAKHKAKGGLTASVNNYYISPSVRWIGQSTNYRITTPGQTKQRVKSHIVTDLNMGVNNIWKAFSASINIQNLQDKRYYNAGGNSARHPSVPQEPRRVVLTLNYKF
jgi:iron complex outermembrane receptor protein